MANVVKKWPAQLAAGTPSAESTHTPASARVLHTDFHDYYDQWFAETVTGRCDEPGACAELIPSRRVGEIIIFTRLTRDHETRDARLDELACAGFMVPRHGTVTQLAAIPDGHRPTDLVVYTDPYAHAGEGKALLPLCMAISQYPSAYAAEYLPSDDGPALARSYRWLRAGGRAWVLEYVARRAPESECDGLVWRSNVEMPGIEVDVHLLYEVQTNRGDFAPLFKLPYPLVAVDLVADTAGQLFAVDLNTAPRVSGTGIEKEVSPLDFYKLIIEG